MPGFRDHFSNHVSTNRPPDLSWRGKTGLATQRENRHWERVLPNRLVEEPCILCHSRNAEDIKHGPEESWLAD